MKGILFILFIHFFLGGFAQTDVSFTIDKSPLFSGAKDFDESSIKLKNYVNDCGLSIGGGKEAVFIQFIINQEG